MADYNNFSPFDPRAYGMQADGKGQGGVYMPFGINGGYMSSQEAKQAVPNAEAEMARRQAAFMAAQPHTRTQRMMAGEKDPYAAMARPWAQGAGTIPAMGRGKPQGGPQMAGMFGHDMPAPPSAVPVGAGPVAGRRGPPSVAELAGYNAMPNPVGPRR